MLPAPVNLDFESGRGGEAPEGGSLGQSIAGWASRWTEPLPKPGLAGRPSRLCRSDRIEEQFGTWRTAFGEINRFQRPTGEVEQRFSDDASSNPVGFSGGWTGSLASFFAPPRPGNKRQ